MKKYQLEVKFSYLINTENMERVLEKMEFPSFDLDDNSHEFLDSSYSWEEAEEDTVIREISQKETYDSYPQVSTLLIADIIRALMEDEGESITFDKLIEALAGEIKNWYPQLDEVTFWNDCEAV